MKILIAEDDTRLSSRLKDDLGRRGYAVDVAANGIDAEHLGSEWPYDAVILASGCRADPASTCCGTGARPAIRCPF